MTEIDNDINILHFPEFVSCETLSEFEEIETDDNFPSNNEKRHKITYSRYQQNSNKCHFCDRTRKSVGNLKRLLCNHFVEKPFSCQKCNQHFTRIDFLQNHLTKAHSINSKEEKNKLSGVEKKNKYECPISTCEAKFPTKCVLEKHIKKNAHQPLQCSFCYKKFLSFDLLKTHEIIHPELLDEIQNEVLIEEGNSHDEFFNEFFNAQYKCKICGLSFSTPSILKRHVNIHEKIQQSERDEKGKSNLTDDTIGCIYCGKLFSSMQTLARHVRLHTGEKPFSCKWCYRCFTRKDKLKIHLQKDHSSDSKNSKESNSNVDTEKMFTCLQCKKKFLSQSNLAVHINSHSDVRKNKLSFRKKLSKIKYKCIICKKSFSVLAELVCHMKIHINENNKKNIVKGKKNTSISLSKKSLACDFCNGIFNDISELALHKKTHSANEKFYCTICEIGFSALQLLISHAKSHTGQKQFECDHCKKRFYRKDILEQHLKIHVPIVKQKKLLTELNIKICTGQSDNLKPGKMIKSISKEKLHYCSSCEMKFSYACQLEKHLSVHLNEKQFPCIICGKSFDYSFRLNQHLKIHSGESNFECKVCHKTFSMLGNYKRHMRKHTGETPFECNQCNQAFDRKDKLSNHIILTHIKILPFKCEECSLQFETAKNLQLHMLSHREKFKCEFCKEDFYCQSELYDHRLKHTGEVNHKCPDCDRYYTYPKNLIKHEQIHKVKPFKCSECNKSFVHESTLSNHLVLHKKFSA